MKLRIIAVGHKQPKWVDEAFGEYAKRFPAHCKLELVELKPEARADGIPAERIMAAEAVRIQKELDARDATTIALDERGKALTTVQLSQWLQEWLASGRDVNLIIGGADGLHPPIKQAADKLLALSAMTMPHGMVRVLLAEQLYRALSILENHPYHRV
jgi:23S rRNA (pseudouridine1915-N3)-methyltransferase